MSDTNKEPNWKSMALLCLAILAAGAAVTVLVFSTEPEAERTGATRETAMLVEVVEAQVGDYRPRIHAMGTVEPAREIILSPRIEGQVIEHHAAFDPGAFVPRGTTLLQVDPADFRNRLEQRRSELRQAQAELSLEQGRVDVARRDYQLLGESVQGENKSLVLREPQLEAARSRVSSARAAAAQAELDLARTRIEAPFDALILRRNVNVGSQVAPGDDLGRLVGTGTYWIAATIPLSQLRWLHFSGEGGDVSPVRVRNRTAWRDGDYRQGRLFRLVGTLEEQTRMARVLIAVDDPLAREPGNAGQPSLILGSYVEAIIEGEELSRVVPVNRDYLRQDDTVWLMEEGRLRIQPVQVVTRDADFAYVGEGLEGGESIVTSNLATVTEGAPLRLKNGRTTAAETESETR